MQALRRHSLCLALCLLPMAVDAAPCAGFADVSDSDSFCPNVDWLKNRKITLGCGNGTNYCPGDFVTRLQMAAFMNRLGVVFTPLVLSTQESVPNPANGQVACVTADVSITDYRRFVSAISTATFSGMTSSTGFVAARNVFSQDGGQNWQSFDATDSQLDYAYAPSHAGGTITVTALGNERAIFASPFRFGVQLVTTDPVTQTWCQLRATITNRNGTNVPY